MELGELGELGAGQAQPMFCFLRGWGRAELLESLGIRAVPQLSLISWPKIENNSRSVHVSSPFSGA